MNKFRGTNEELSEATNVPGVKEVDLTPEEQSTEYWKQEALTRREHADYWKQQADDLQDGAAWSSYQVLLRDAKIADLEEKLEIRKTLRKVNRKDQHWTERTIPVWIFWALAWVSSVALAIYFTWIVNTKVVAAYTTEHVLRMLGIG